MNQARFFKALPRLTLEHPKARWVFLTLTVENPRIEDLGDTLTLMNRAWQRLKDRKEFRPVLGWARATEVTKPADERYAHPHFHVLLMVPPSWFTRHYVKQARFRELWAECLGVDYLPQVRIETVKSRRAPGADGDPSQALGQAIAETFKYSTKPADMVSSEAWFLELTRQTHRRRFLACGGALKDVLKAAEESDRDLVGEGEDDDDDGSRLAFSWRDTDRHYRRSPKADRSPYPSDS